jgi:hypothetical protein
MMDPKLFLMALGGAAGTAAAMLLLCSWPWRKVAPRRTAAAAVLGAGLGFYIGCRLLGLEAHWPPTEDRDRLLFILFPAVIAIEFLAAVVGRFRWLFRLLRLILAVAAARVLLHKSIYLADPTGPRTQEWTFQESCLFLGGMAAALVLVWGALALLMNRSPSRSVPLAVAFACGCAGVTLLLSGYALAGMTGLALAAALVGVVAASVLVSGPDLSGLIGVGVVGLFALLVVGRFFGELTTPNAALIFFSLLLCWLPEMPGVRGLRPGLRGLARILLVALPIVPALVLAQQQFAKDFDATSPGAADEPSSQDYENFGK